MSRSFPRRSVTMSGTRYLTVGERTKYASIVMEHAADVNVTRVILTVDISENRHYTSTVQEVAGLAQWQSVRLLVITNSNDRHLKVVGSTPTFGSNPDEIFASRSGRLVLIPVMPSKSTSPVLRLKCIKPAHVPAVPTICIRSLHPKESRSTVALLRVLQVSLLAYNEHNTEAIASMQW